MSVGTSVITFDDAIANYYRLKHQYEQKYNKEKSKLIKNNILTRGEKRARLANYERKCVSCGKTGGTIFKQENNVLIAQCGHTINPCKLNIQLQKAKYNNINDEIQNIHKNILNNKFSTIKSKYDFLFGFEKEGAVLEDFNKLKAQLIEEVKVYRFMYEKYLNIISEKTPPPLLNQLVILISEFKDLINKYEISNNSMTMKDAIELYVTSIDKINKQIRDTKYSVNGLLHDPDNATHYLIQEVFTLSDIIVPKYNSENKVLSYIA